MTLILQLDILFCYLIIDTICYCNSEQIVEEAGGVVTCMDGGKFCVFDRSVLVSNGVLHAKVSLSAVISTIYF